MKILCITVNSEIDPDADLSFFGEYSSKKAKWAIDRAARHDQGRNKHRYFHPANPPRPEMSREERRRVWQDCERSYERMESYNRGGWQMMFIHAVAQIDVGDTIQFIRSGGIGQIESDASQDYLELHEAEEKEALAVILKEMGFSQEAIEEAM